MSDIKDKFVNGVGGVFIFSNRAAVMAEWYHHMFGIDFEKDEKGKMFYSVFLSLHPDDYRRKLDTTFSILHTDKKMEKSVEEGNIESMYGDQPFMVNLRVENLETLLQHLKTQKVKILGYQEEIYGKFAWVCDPDGNRIELYESGYSHTVEQEEITE